MNTQIHRKQIIILVLAMALAAVSYWIPLPQKSQLYSSSTLGESPNLSTPAETLAYVREPATIWRFPVTLQMPQKAPIQAALAPEKKETQLDQPLPATQLINQRDFTNNGMTNPSLVPVKELNYHMKN
ncbi:MAG TPA: hypothetical protein P5149_13255 [Candidatus Competibacteraceae bacterium]|nr:hypothetical protein [Candidatus Competibacteraceae bacterium]HPF59026.1 hypothetical protein [Candidatus Competibacteraceae bacterium]HRY19357.1 hypothetical protein [Candidatus Competibacteraceae bacterium]